MLFVADVVLLLNFHDKQYVLMSCHYQTIVQSFMHQRPEMRSTKRARVEHWPVCPPPPPPLPPNASARPKAHARYFRACKPSTTDYCVN